MQAWQRYTPHTHVSLQHKSKRKDTKAIGIQPKHVSIAQNNEAERSRKA
jgi:hypothetical protein